MLVVVICINNLYYPLSLEINKEYNAIDKGKFYIIVDENLEDCEYPKDIFEIKKNTDII